MTPSARKLHRKEAQEHQGQQVLLLLDFLFPCTHLSPCVPTLTASIGILEIFDVDCGRHIYFQNGR